MFLLVDEKGRKYLVKGDSDLHTNYGVITAEKLDEKNVGSVIETHSGRKFFIIPPRIIDFMEKARRGPQAMTLKDCSLIAGYTGIRSKSRVVEAGLGSGVLSMSLANTVAPAELVSYEIREDFKGIAEGNFKRFGVNNVKIKMKDIYEGIDEKNLDLIMLDLPEPWRVVEYAKKSLKAGGHLVSYSPSIEQNKGLFDALGGNFISETIESLVRNWDMKVVRPYSRMLGHTGFITFARWMGEK
jgi:tRNA (adenine57-N1/adenine58-N1)-methyltransferase